MTPVDWRHAIMALTFGMVAAACILAAWLVVCLGHWPATMVQTGIAGGLFILNFTLAGNHARQIGVR
jgi:hypothetical protein